MRQMLMELVLGSFTGRLFRAVESGQYGSGLARLYAATKGYKTRIAAAFLILSGAATEFAPQAAPALALVAIIMGHAGLVDKGSRVIAPEIANQWRVTLQWIMGTLAALSYVTFGLQELLGRVPGCVSCSVWADHLGLGLAAVGTATSWFTAYLDPSKKRIY